MSSRIYLRKRRVDYRVLHFGVRRSLSLANEIIGTEHGTRSIHMTYHTSFLSEICQNFEDHIENSQQGERDQKPNIKMQNPAIEINESRRSYVL